LLLITLVLILAAVLGYFFLNRLAELEQQVAALGGGVGETQKQLAEVIEKSETALQRASQAEENALLAAGHRAQAEAAKTRAESEAKQAREEVEEAREQAENAKQEARAARQEADRIRREREAELDRLQKALSQIVETRRTAMGLVMSLGSDSIQFDFDRAMLHPQNRELLSRIVGILLTSTGYKVDIYGHTDDIGSDEYNLELSRKRALAVRDYLVEAGIDPKILTTEGLGKSRPTEEATTREARAKNRRVEIAVINTIVDYEGPATENP
jgi:outer membrane protein OmpA-like peptidoglycan-associated protein